jgi:hypothetical protein
MSRKASLVLVLVAVAVALIGTTAVASATGLDDTNRRLVAELSGPAIDGDEPRGSFEWRGFQTRGDRMDVRIRDVNLPDGTVLTFHSTCFDPETGIPPFERDMTLDDGEASFQLRLDKGDAVPRCERNGTVDILDGTTVVASGDWCDVRTQDC